MNEIEQKEIEEMARCIAFELCPKRHAHANWGEKAQCYSDNNFTECKQIKNVVDKLYNAGYRNCKDKVVLSKEDLKQMVRAKIKCIDNMAIITRKETAREILKDWQNCAVAGNYYTKALSEHINKLAKQYGMEVE